ncbi:MAG: hypothetical protein V4481_02745 [Patescibacteria group bacterium]
MKKAPEKATENIFVTTVMGEKYTRIYNETFRPSQERFIQKIGADFYIIDDIIERSPNHSHPSWQKMLMFRLPEIASHKRALFVDADVYITRHARNPFEVVGDVPWSVADNNAYGVKYFADNDPKLYAHCPPNNRPSMMLNLGVYIVTEESRSALEKVFYDYKEQPCYDNGPASYHLLNGPKGKILPSEFNTLVLAYLMAYGRGLSVMLRMYKEASFLHFAGGPTKSLPMLPLVRYIDTHPDSLLTRMIFFFGKPKYDRITEPLMRAIAKVMTVYAYHIKRRFAR